MSHIRIDKQKATKKWAPVLENMGVVGSDRIEWMAEYAEYHSINESGVAYANNANVSGMGNVVGSSPATLSGNTIAPYAGGTIGSGDIGQQLLPVAMKIAAQTIGLDLVAVKPTPGPKIDLLYVDFEYDNTPGFTNEKPQIFKLSVTDNAGLKTALTAGLTAAGRVETVGGLSERIWISIGGSLTTIDPDTLASKAGYLEFLGFSRIDGLPMFRSYRQANTASSGGNSVAWGFDTALNTFGATAVISTVIGASSLQSVSCAGAGVSLVSALEDHIPGMSNNFSNNLHPMSRLQDDQTYPGVIAPRLSSKSVAVGTVEISSSLKRTEVEDIKANTGIDIVQKMESILVNELSQTISKQIVAKIFEMGELNALSAPTNANGSIFNYTTAGTQPGGETTHAMQRKLVSKILNASNYIATEGRVGPAHFAVTNGNLASVLMDIAGYTINPVKSKITGSGQLYPVGQIGDISIYVDPYMKYNDNRITVGRKNNPDQPGIIFVPYLMAQSISIISEATFAPRMLLRSRYAVTEVGFYPQKQYMTIRVTDTAGYLI